jgi:F-type H+-transporting ATPase subunit b
LRRLIISLAASACFVIAQHASEPAAAPGAHGASPAAVQHGAEQAKTAAEHGEGHQQAPMPNEIWWKWANFAILAGGLGFLVSKHAGPFFRTRSEEIQKGISEAAAVRREAEARAAGIESQIANLSSEVEALRQKSRDEIVREGERVRAETAQLIAKVQRQAESDIAAAAKNAALELKAYSAELAINMAGRQIQDGMTQHNQDQLADAFVDDIRRRAALN